MSDFIIRDIIKQALLEIDRDVIRFKNISPDKKLKVICLNKVLELTTEEYLSAYYQTFTRYLDHGNIGFDVFSLCKYFIDGESSTEIREELDFYLSGINGDIEILFFSEEKKQKYKPLGEGKLRFSLQTTSSYLNIFIEDLMNYVKNEVAKSNREITYILIPINLDMKFMGDENHQCGLIIEHTAKQITFCFYEPIGNDNITIGIIKFGKVLTKALEENFNLPVVFSQKLCNNTGLQRKMNAPHCVMFTYLWFYVFYLSSLSINKPMKSWINEVENLISEWILNSEKPINTILAFMYMIIEKINIFMSKKQKYTSLDEPEYQKIELEIIEEDLKKDYKWREIINLYREKLTHAQLLQIIFGRNVPNFLDKIKEGNSIE